MKSPRVKAIPVLLAAFLVGAGGQSALDQRAEDFLARHRDAWHDLNIPAVDGQKLFDLILENGYTRAVEIGTSTGHSAIWMAWALSKTGGKLITVEIDPERYETAVANFEEAGLDPWIDARLADASRRTTCRSVAPAPGAADGVTIASPRASYARCSTIRDSKRSSSPPVAVCR